jgi:Lrp/AsnC family transcriptional regulator for asnA, asnC and gidA
MDELDERLIALLREDARISYVQLAADLGITEGTVRARVKRLQEDGVIRSFTIRTASRNIKALVELKIELNTDTSQISMRIREMPEVEAVYEVAGDADIIAVVDVLSVKDLNTVIERIRSIGPTMSTQTRLVLNEL